MMSVPTTTDFFVAGGTLRPGAPSYVKRPADDELFNLALSGEFCYVLTPRQMGKSSLMIRTAHRLRESGVGTAIIDLTSVGTDVSAEQWYLGLITRLKVQLDLSVDPDGWWSERASLGAVRRFTDFLHDVVLAEIEGPVVIFIDEIDTTLNLGFSDDFFAAIRFTYNARASDPAYERLTFVLLGVTTPADLIKDRSRTPFNIGQGIDLREFSQEDAQVLQQGLQAACGGQGEVIFTRIFHWTNGHPYLTQRLCLAVAERGNERWTGERVDDLVERLFLLKEARKEANLQFVRDRILTYPQCSQLLTLYGKVYKGKRIGDDERSLMQSQLKLSGLVKAESGVLRIRNEIYRRVFDLAWVRENTAINWAPIVAGIAVFVALLAIGSVVYDRWLESQCRNYVAIFYQASTREERLADLAEMFRLKSPFEPTICDDTARELFYGLEEQLALFDVPNVEESDLVVVIRGLYGTLADVDETDSTGPLLEAMARALNRHGGTEESFRLREEIDVWRDGRELAKQDLDQALQAYNKAIALNSQNPAILYERARGLIELSRYPEALDDLDRVVFIAGESSAATAIPSEGISPIQTLPLGGGISPVRTPAPSVTTISTSPLVPTETPVPMSMSVPVSVVSEFATFGQMISAVRNLICSNPDLTIFVASASRSEYPNLRESGLVPMACKDTHEPDEYEHYRDWPPLELEPGEPVEGYVCAEHIHLEDGEPVERDWYWFEITILCDITVDLDVPDTVNYDLFLWVGEWVGAENPERGADERIEWTAEAIGTYVVVVKSRGDADNCTPYSLHVTCE
jgi:tetratricopeptide (TPR) repeat protein